MSMPDPGDPLGLAADAPLLAAWLDWTRRAEAGHPGAQVSAEQAESGEPTAR